MILGIDPSLSNTGLAIGDNPDSLDVFTCGTENMGDSPFQRTIRNVGLVETIMCDLKNFSPVTHVFVEGYSYHRVHLPSAEFRGELYRRLSHDPNIWIVEVPPTTLKQFVIGKGQGAKELVRLHAYKRWGVDFDTNDEVDAYGLFRLGLCVIGKDKPTCEAQRKAVAKVEEIMSGKKPKRPRKKKVSK